MIYASEFRKGITFEIDGEPHVVLDFQHVKPGKGAAFVRTKYRNILSGATREEAFNPNDKFPKAHIETRVMQYLYSDGELYYFMDQETYDQIELSKDDLGDNVYFLKDEMVIDVSMPEPPTSPSPWAASSPGSWTSSTAGSSSPRTSASGACGSGQPSVEKGHRPDENHVSSTSSSCRNATSFP